MSASATALVLSAFPGATFVELADDDHGGHALAYGLAGWDVFPLRGKAPWIRRAHPPGHPCKGECGRDGHGVLDATSDLAKIGGWWDRWPDANIGGRVPRGVAVLDSDPRKGGSFQTLELGHGPLPATCACVSGRGDGGEHRYWQHPGGPITAKRLPAGIDLKTHAGYCVLPPSIHPDSGQRYQWQDLGAAILAMPSWLVDLLRVKRRPVTPPRPRQRLQPVGDSPADWFTAATTWPEILEPHGWTAIDPAGTRWLHPNATSELSATVTNDCLFVYSTSTVFEQTEASSPHGYTRFRAWAVLNHGGDLSAAARAVLEIREKAA
jgi:Bifunctional DNA primase/polymerase, N-terminal